MFRKFVLLAAVAAALALPTGAFAHGGFGMGGFHGGSGGFHGGFGGLHGGPFRGGHFYGFAIFLTGAGSLSHE